MNEGAETMDSLPALLLLSFWWAVLSAFDLFFGPNWPGNAEPQTSALSKNGETSSVPPDPRFDEIRRLDPRFDPAAFLAGARSAYEMVLQAYAQGDIETLRGLASAEVLAVFAASCEARRQRQATMELVLVGLESAEITDIWTGSEAMEISVLFKAELIRVERSSSGEILSGDAAAILPTADRWTFARSLPLQSPAWTIIATDTGEDQPG